MDGKILLYQLRQLLEENATSSFLDDRTSYDFLYEAATEFTKITRALTGSQTITTVANQSSYNLNSDYLYMYPTSDRNEYFIKYFDGASYFYPVWRDYADTVYSNNTTATSIPSSFSILDAPFQNTISSTATANGLEFLGECSLVDSTQTFLSTVSPGDSIHNTSDGSDGIIINVLSDTIIAVALFGGTLNGFTSGDDYIIVPEGRKMMVLDPAPLTSGHTITFKYIAKPMPVYSQLGRYRFDATAMPAITKYAAWLYKYRDREANTGDRWFQYWEKSIRQNLSYTNKSLNRNSWKVNFNKRTLNDRSYR
jgi:hypothetical protein